MNLHLGIIYVLTIMAETIGIYVITTRAIKNYVTYMFLGCKIASVLWCISQIGIFLSENDIQTAIAYGIGNVGICFIGTLWVNFAVGYCFGGNKLFTGITFGASLFFVTAVLTNPWHHLYYSSFHAGGREYGVLFYANKYYIYLCVLVGILCIIYHQSSERELIRRRLLFAVVILPFGLNLLEHFGVLQARYEITPLGFSVSCMLTFVAIFRYNFLDVDKRILEEIVEDIHDGILIFDESGDLAFANREALELWDSGFYRRDSDFFSFLESMDGAGAALKERDEIILRSGEKYYQIQKIISRNTYKALLGTSFLIRDVSRYYETLEQTKKMALLEQKLAIEKEQNAMIQKVHDTQGHTLTMIQSLIKLGLYEKDPEKSRSYLEEARGLAAGGIRELREFILQSRKEKKGEFVTWYIEKLAKSVREVPVEVQFVGQDGEKYLAHCDVVYSGVKEFITNSLRYAHAGKIQIIVKFQEKEMELYLFDDGIGCDHVVPGNGLRGMCDRVHGCGGEIRMISAKGEGFQTYISLPVV